MERILITGAFGFLGRHLLADLAASRPGTELVAVDLAPAPRDARPGVRYLGGVDVHDVAALTEAMRGADAVAHLAGLVSFWEGDRDRLFRVNQLGTRSVAQACVNARVKRLVHVSSVAAIGFNDREDEPASEELAFDWVGAIENRKHYMLSKRASEDELRRAAAAGIQVAIANPGLMYGPGDRVNAPLFRAVQAGRVRVVPPGGTNVVDVRDVAAGIRMLLFSGVRDERFILGGHNLRFSEIVGWIGRATGAPASPGRLPRWVRAPLCAATGLLERLRSTRPALTRDHVDSSFRFRYFTSRKAARVLGWRARIPFGRTAADTARELAAAGLLRPTGGAA